MQREIDPPPSIISGFCLIYYRSNCQWISDLGRFVNTVCILLLHLNIFSFILTVPNDCNQKTQSERAQPQPQPSYMDEKKINNYKRVIDKYKVRASRQKSKNHANGKARKKGHLSKAVTPNRPYCGCTDRSSRKEGGWLQMAR